MYIGYTEITSGDSPNEGRGKINGQLEYLYDNMSGGSSILVYKAIISQSGTNAPTAVILENTLGEVPVLTRGGSPGYYELTISGGLFVEEKTFFHNGTSCNSTGIIRTGWNSVNDILIWTNDMTLVAKDGVLYNTAFLIEVYP